MEVVALAIVGLAVLIVFSLGSKGGSPEDSPAALPSSNIFDIYNDVLERSAGDSADTRDKKDKLRAKLGELEREMKYLEDLRAAWENKRTDRKDVFDTFKAHGEKIAATAGEAKELLTALKETLER